MIENFTAQPYPLWAVVCIAGEDAWPSAGLVIGWFENEDSVWPLVHYADIGQACRDRSIAEYWLFTSYPAAVRKLAEETKA